MVKVKPGNLARWDWARNDLPIEYRDHEWGVPQHDGRVLCEFLLLEGARAQPKLETILRKRKNYRASFDNFDGKKTARYDHRKIVI